MLVCLKYCLQIMSKERSNFQGSGLTYDKTLEKSVDGVMTKLSLLFDQDMSSCILGSSNILADELAYRTTSRFNLIRLLRIQLVNKSSLHHLGLLRRCRSGSTQTSSGPTLSVIRICVSSVGHPSTVVHLRTAMARWTHLNGSRGCYVHRLSMIVELNDRNRCSYGRRRKDRNISMPVLQRRASWHTFLLWDPSGPP